ncbi:MAG: hypothetical protein GY765_27350, partial [bacterium]|nr:hypothetical protein [bacterium]
MIVILLLLIPFLYRNYWFRTRSDLIIENEMLRQQLKILKRQLKRPKLNWRDRIYWVLIRLTWCNWKDVLHIFKPATVAA